MKKLLLQLSLLLVFCVTASFAQDSPLVELAKKEKERRAKVKAARTVTNKDVEEWKAKQKEAGALVDEEEGAAAETEATPSEGTQTVSETDLSNNEEYWRDKTKDTSNRVKQAEKKVDELQSDVNALTRAFYAEGDGVAQRGQIQAERNKRLEQIESAKKELEEAKAAQENLEDEARESGAPPGWVRSYEDEEPVPEESEEQ